MRTALVLLAVLAAVAVPATDARFNDRSQSAMRVAAASATDYFHVYSESTDPGAVTGYANRRGTTPAVRAATGADRTVAVHMGGWRNQNATYVDRVVTIKAEAAFPPGVTQLTLRATRAPDPVTGEQPLTAGRFQRMNDTDGGATITLSPNEQVELDLEVRMRPPEFPNGGPGSGLTYTPTVTVWATWAGYSDDFFAYVIPVRVFNGDGPG